MTSTLKIREQVAADIGTHPDLIGLVQGDNLILVVVSGKPANKSFSEVSLDVWKSVHDMLVTTLHPVPMIQVMQRWP